MQNERNTSLVDYNVSLFDHSINLFCQIPHRALILIFRLFVLEVQKETENFFFIFNWLLCRHSEYYFSYPTAEKKAISIWLTKDCNLFSSGCICPRSAENYTLFLINYTKIKADFFYAYYYYSSKKKRNQKNFNE